MKLIPIIAILSVSLALSGTVYASELVYHGINPDITPTADPNNGPNIANLANLTKPAASSPNTSLSDAEIVKQGVLSGISITLQQQLTGNATSSGTVQFGDGSFATYTTSGGIRTIVIHDLDGQITTISFPIS